MISKERAFELFGEYVGHPEDYESEWSIFSRYLEEDEPSDEAEVIDYLKDLAGENDDESDPSEPNPDNEPPKKNKRLDDAIQAAKALLNK